MNTYHDPFFHLITRPTPPEPDVLVKIPAVIHNAFRTPILLIKELEPDYKGWTAFRRLIEDEPRKPNPTDPPLTDRPPDGKGAQ
jgi:hypothetical protein